MLEQCSARSSSTSTSRSRGPVPSSVPRRIAGSVPPTGFTLDPARYEEARLAAFEDLRGASGADARRGDLGDLHRGHRARHGRGCGRGAARCAAAIVRPVGGHANFDLYDDAVPVIETLRGTACGSA